MSLRVFRHFGWVTILFCGLALAQNQPVDAGRHTEASGYLYVTAPGDFEVSDAEGLGAERSTAFAEICGAYNFRVDRDGWLRVALRFTRNYDPIAATGRVSVSVNGVVIDGSEGDLEFSQHGRKLTAQYYVGNFVGSPDIVVHLRGVQAAVAQVGATRGGAAQLRTSNGFTQYTGIVDDDIVPPI